MRNQFATILSRPKDIIATYKEIEALAIMDPKVIEQVQKEINDVRAYDTVKQVQQLRIKL